ncbi:MAG TPA: acylphosphatase [Cyclobacteriaceae bacterium]|jgi:acylphosphatase|nr:acylphosphatase [Cyclobacteriaceae bacterium]
MVKHLNIRVSGKVQGVFFRASTKEQADQLGVNGFVRNEPNGDVYIEVEGNEEKSKLFSDWCKRGPNSARVDSFKVEEADLKNFVSFEVRR